MSCIDREEYFLLIPSKLFLSKLAIRSRTRAPGDRVRETRSGKAPTMSLRYTVMTRFVSSI